jgi:hypothetical protein
LWLAMTLLQHCFVSTDFFQCKNIWFMIGRWWCFCIVSFLEASLLEKLDSLVMFWWCFYFYYK